MKTPIQNEHAPQCSQHYLHSRCYVVIKCRPIDDWLKMIWRDLGKIVISPCLLLLKPVKSWMKNCHHISVWKYTVLQSCKINKINYSMLHFIVCSIIAISLRKYMTFSICILVCHFSVTSNFATLRTAARRVSVREIPQEHEAAILSTDYAKKDLKLKSPKWQWKLSYF